MNFRLTADERLRAAIIGIPSWIRRKREIEDRMENAIAVLRDAPDAKRVELAEELLAPINSLIEKHNAYYPIEANLPVDVKTGRLMERGGIEPWQPMRPVTTSALLARAS